MSSIENALDERVKIKYNISKFSVIQTSGNTLLYFDDDGLPIVQFEIVQGDWGSVNVVEFYYRDKLENKEI